MRPATIHQPRGRPVVALGAILGVWVAFRLVFWESPLAPAFVRAESAAAQAFETLVSPQQLRAPKATPEQAAPRGRQGKEPARQDWYRPPPAALKAPVMQPIGAIDSAMEGAPAARGTLPAAPSAQSTTGPLTARQIVGHNLLLAAGLSALPMSPLLTPYVAGRGPRAAAVPAAPDPVFAPATAQRFIEEGAAPRWSMSGWAFLRDGAPAGRQAATTPGYGRSQVGAVLAYALAPASAHRPQAYTRATAATEGPREADLAAGLSARPVPGVPVRVAAEARLSLRSGQTELRPAVYAVSELPPQLLPAGMVGEAYAQAGWVGGDFATGFVDGQARITRPVLREESFTLSAGAGTWAGAQRGTSRLDVGPTVSVSFPVSEDVYGRVSADYRLRVAGNAAPASGPALTLSAGF